MRVAVIGCGQIADLHITEIQKIEGVELVGVCDLNEIMAEQAAVRFGVRKYYTDFRQLLREQQPEVVHITTQPQSHLPLGKIALEHGAHVYMEKPFTLNAAEAEELVVCAQKAGRQVCVGHNYDFDRGAMDARQLVAEGRLGEVLHVDSAYSYDLQGSFGRLLLEKPKHWLHDLPGKLFQNVAVHAVCKVTGFIPDPMPVVQAAGFKLRPERFGDARDCFHDEVRVFLRGQRVSGHVVFSSHIRPMLHYMRLYGTKGTVHVDWHARTVRSERVSSLPGAIGRLVVPFEHAAEGLGHGLRNAWRFVNADLQYNDGMNRLFRLFYAAIREGKPSPIPMTEAVRVTRVLDEIIRQLHS